jgi:NTE family protein
LLDDERIRQPGLRFEAVLDRLDSYAYPRSGLLLSVSVDSAREQWGAEQPFTRAEARIGGALSRGEHTIAGKLEWGDRLDGDGSLPPYALFQLGGPRRLAGLYLDQLTGSQYRLAGINYYWQFASLPSQLGRGMYLGASLESGTIDDSLVDDNETRTSSASLFWGAQTILGVAYIGAGRTDDGQGAVYLSIGPRF